MDQEIGAVRLTMNGIESLCEEKEGHRLYERGVGSNTPLIIRSSESHDWLKRKWAGEENVNKTRPYVYTAETG